MTEVLHSKAFQQFLCLLYGGLFRQPRNLPVKYKASQVLNWSGREALASSRLPPGQLAWFGFSRWFLYSVLYLRWEQGVLPSA